MLKVSGRSSRRLVGAVACALTLGAVTAGSASAVGWSTSLSGAEQIASHLPGDPDGTGSATITVTGTTLCADVSFANIAQPVVWAHIHGGAHGQPENIGWTINLFGPNINGTASPSHACTIVTPAQTAAMLKAPMLFNVVVHNKEYPAGAIRGQLSNAPLCGVISQSLCVGSLSH